MSEQTEAQRLADLLDVGEISKTGMSMAANELRRLEAEKLSADKLLRCSVPDRWKSCTSPVGAVQSYIAELEEANAELLEALKESQAVLRAVSKDDPTFQLARYGLQIVRAAIAKHGAPQ